MTIEKIREIMKIPADRMAALLAQNGIPNIPGRELSAAEMKKLQQALLRSHRSAPLKKAKPAPAPAPAESAAPAAEESAAPAVAESAVPAVAECAVPAVEECAAKCEAAPEPQVSEPQAPIDIATASAPLDVPMSKPVEVWDGPVDPQMEQLVLSKHIMIDTCSLMHDKCELLIDKLLPALQKHQKKIKIPAKVIGELKKHQKATWDPFKVVAADKGLRLCNRLQKAGCLSVRGDKRDNFADNTFFVVISKYRYQYDILLITQDRKLSQDILRLNEMQSVQGHPVEVQYLTGRGELRRSVYERT